MQVSLKETLLFLLSFVQKCNPGNAQSVFSLGQAEIFCIKDFGFRKIKHKRFQMVTKDLGLIKSLHGIC